MSKGMKYVIEIKELYTFINEIVQINSQQAAINKQKCYSIRDSGTSL